MPHQVGHVFASIQIGSRYAKKIGIALQYLFALQPRGLFFVHVCSIYCCLGALCTVENHVTLVSYPCKDDEKMFHCGPSRKVVADSMVHEPHPIFPFLLFHEESISLIECRLNMRFSYLLFSSCHVPFFNMQLISDKDLLFSVLFWWL